MSAPDPKPNGFYGIYPMQYAFFNRDASLDLAALRRQVDACINAGCHGIAVLGLAQEVAKLTLAERRSVVECTAAQISGRVPLAVTIAEPNIAAQIEFARFATEAGASWLILQPPPTGGVSEAALLEFFSAVMRQVELPVAIQNAPGLIANSLSAPAIRNLAARHGNFRLLKAEGPATYVHQLIQDTQQHFAIFNGYAGLTLPDSLRAGCAGLIPSTDTVDAQVRVFNLFTAGRMDEAEQQHRDILPLLVMLMTSVENLVAYGKHLAARRLGFSEVFPRAPHVTPSAFGLACLDRAARQLGALP